MKPSVLFFDFDDTLGNRNIYCYKCWRRVIEENSGVTDPVELEAIVQNCMIWDQNGDVAKEYVIRRLNEEYGITVPYEDFEGWWADHLYEYSVPFDDAQETLQELKRRGYRMGVISNGPSNGQRMKLEKTGLAGYFEEIIVSGDYGIHKPDPKLFQIAAERMHAKPSDCVMIGDIFARDVLGAYRAGMKAIWVWTSGDRPCMAEIPVVHSLHEILQYFA